MNRGDVVILDFALYDPTDKVRPALVVQNDRDNARGFVFVTLRGKLDASLFAPN